MKKIITLGTTGFIFLSSIIGATPLSMHTMQKSSTSLQSQTKFLSPSTTVDAKLDFFGSGTVNGHNTHFAELEHTTGANYVQLREGIDMKEQQVASAYSSYYAYIQIKNSDKKILFTKAFRGTDYVSSQEETIPLPENSSIYIFHAEGGTDKFTTNDDSLFKISQGGYGTSYNYIMKNGKLQNIYSQDYIERR